MNKELQDLAWSILPKEFKEEVKSKYKNAVRLNEYAHECVVLRDLFGEDNLTSDAEGEEMLMVPRKKIQDFFMNFKREKSDAKSVFDKISLGARMSMLQELFGSKCLPDEKEFAENANCTEPKPAEPKFKGGDLALVRGFKHPLLEHDGAIVTILSYHEKGDFYSCAIAPNVGIDVDAKYLEPYTEPSKEESATLHAESVEESRIADEETHLRNLSQETANCDKQFDNILKDSLLKERRLNIAAQIAQTLIQGVNFLYTWSDEEIKGVAHNSIRIADTLIAEVEIE